jgi:Uncharacterized protein conserved in archaea (DUF2226)
MELPITRPSMMCYADEVEFPDILNDLSAKKHNGFIRITTDSEEGFILFKDGKEIAASFIRYSRVDAIEKIKSAMQDNSTIIEIFNVRQNQIDFFMDMNKPYIIGSDAYDLINELKKPDETNTELEQAPKPKAVPKPKYVSEALKDQEIGSKSIKNNIEKTSKPLDDPVISTLNPSNDYVNLPTDTIEPVLDSEMETEPINETVNEVKEIETIEEPINKIISNDETISEPVMTKTEVKETPKVVSSTNKAVSENLNPSPESSENGVVTNQSEEVKEIPMDRSELMKKYGIKDIQEEDVSNILESYKGGSVSDEDVEKIELTLMNKIKKSILAIPKIRGAEVMVFLDNTDGLSGKVNIIIESETKGFISRIMGDSKTINIERQIIEISQIEIRKSFRKYPEIVDKFNVNVEIS